MEEAYRAALACLPGMSSVALPRLIKMAGSAVELWNILARGGGRAAALVGAEKSVQWSRECSGTEPGKVLGDLSKRGIRVLLPSHPCFPRGLRCIFDPPALLFMLGREPPGEVPYIAIVGARKASSYGRWASQTIAAELARRGAVIVSGAAYGVDGHAHLGCLKVAGFTIAVLGCGIDQVYPAQHADLLRRIASSGCVLSEYPPGDGPLPWRFPHRNRIIAGLSHAVVVVEASAKSGALITADMALDEGREVMAVPGPVGSPLSEGTNGLIQKGAKLVMSTDDILEELPVEIISSQEKCKTEANGEEPGTLPGLGAKDTEKEIDPRERTFLDLLQGHARGLDWLAAKTGIPPGELLAHLTSMTLKGWVCEEVGGKYRLLTYPTGASD